MISLVSYRQGKCSRGINPLICVLKFWKLSCGLLKIKDFKSGVCGGCLSVPQRRPRLHSQCFIKVRMFNRILSDSLNRTFQRMCLNHLETTNDGESAACPGNGQRSKLCTGGKDGSLQHVFQGFLEVSVLKCWFTSAFFLSVHFHFHLYSLSALFMCKALWMFYFGSSLIAVHEVFQQ